MNAAELYAEQVKLTYETPMLSDVGHLFELPKNIELYLKLENMQVNGILTLL